MFKPRQELESLLYCFKFSFWAQQNIFYCKNVEVVGLLLWVLCVVCMVGKTICSLDDLIYVKMHGYNVSVNIEFVVCLAVHRIQNPFKQTGCCSKHIKHSDFRFNRIYNPATYSISVLFYAYMHKAAIKIEVVYYKKINRQKS